LFVVADSALAVWTRRLTQQWPFSGRALLVSVMAASVSGCTLPNLQLALPNAITPSGANGGGATGSIKKGTPLGDAADPGTERPRVFNGTGNFLNEPGAQQSRATSSENGAGVTIDLVNASPSEAAKAVLGDIMGVTYIVSDKVKAPITLKTAGPVSKDGLLEIFESVLTSSGAAILVDGAVYKVVPMDEAIASGKITRNKPGQVRKGVGVTTQIVPLRYVSAAEMERVLKSMAPLSTISRVDTARNLLVITGTGAELTSMLDTINVFDVDYMRGMSFGIFPIESPDPAAIAQELDTIFANDRTSPTKGMVRFVPNARLKAILVMTSRAEYLKKAETWINRIDLAGRATQKQAFVYHVQYRQASEIAQLLQKLYALPKSQQGAGSAAAAPVAPLATASGEAQPEPETIGSGQTARSLNATVAQPGGPQPISPLLPDFGKSANAAGAVTTPQTAPAAGAIDAAASAPTDQGLTTGSLAQSPFDDRNAGISIIADESNNTILISATPSEIKRIRQVLSQVDIMPNQVLIEATIAEVTLNDQLKFGLRWFFEKGASEFRLTDTAAGLIAPAFPGFSYFLNLTNVQVAINALSTITNVNIVSSPSLTVLDNKKAVLQIGDEVPIATQSAVPVVAPDAPIVNAISFRNTGVILSITPRVSDNGRVLLDIEQEVSDVKQTTSSTIDSPTISQRRIKTTVSVNNGESIVLAGLMQDRSTRDRGQVPLVGDIPLIGNLFKNKTDTIARTELLIAITPHVIRDDAQINQIAAEFRDRMNFNTRPQRETPPDHREQLDRLVR
jgi:general secretion pathway protein D